jgi:hypothetical protein
LGERDPGVAPPAPRRAWLPRALLAVLLAALLGLVLALDPVPGRADSVEPSLLARLLLAPLAMVAAERATSILAVLMLAAAATAGCHTLERRIGSPAPLLVGLLIFGSGSWAAVWGSGADLVPLAVSVVAFALAYGGGGATDEPTEIYRADEEVRGGVARWLAVGLLLAELLPTGPLLAGLLLPAALAVPRDRRRVLVPALLGGFGLGLAGELVARGTDLLTGPAAAAAASLHFSPTLAGWSLTHLLVGRNVGLLAGFAPLLLLLLLGRGAVRRPALVAVCLAVSVLGALALPFDFAAGWLHLPFLPLYGALWHLPSRQPRTWEWVVAVVLSGLATWPLWTPPGAAAAAQGGSLVNAWPRRYLPYEIALRSLPGHGEGQLERHGLRVRAVSGCRLLSGPNRFELDGDGPAEIWLAAPLRLKMAALEFGPGAPSSLELDGAAAGRTVFRPDGRVGFELLLDRPRGRLPLWFGDGDMSVHLIEIGLPAHEEARPLRFRLLAAPRP